MFLASPSHAAPRRANQTRRRITPRWRSAVPMVALALASTSGCGGGGDPVAPPPAPDALLAVTVTPVTNTLTVGATATLTPTATTGGSGVTVRYSYVSSAPTVASVSATGVMTAASPGTATVTVTATGSGAGFTTTTRKATATVTVSAAPPALTAVTLGADSIALRTGGSALLSPLPATGGPTVSVTYAYTSSTPSVATVSTSGAISAVSPGTATITVTATGSGVGFSQAAQQASVVVVVTAPPVALTALTVSPDSVALITSSTATLVPMVSTSGSDVTVSYRFESSAPSIATVSDAGVLTAVGPGSATISVSATGSGSGFTANVLQASVVVTVTLPPPSLTALTVTPDSLTLVTGAAGELTATATPAGSGTTVSYAYASSAAAVATVSDAGIVTAVSPGTATITVTVTGSGVGFGTTVLSETVAVTVTPIVLGVGFGVEQFATVGAGTFQMGSADGLSNERPVRAVAITGVRLVQKTEVTQAQWRQVMQGTGLQNPSAFASCGDTCPVETVSWDNIQLFLQRLNQQDPGKSYRLPTEAEWEYAARAGTTGPYGGTGVLNDMGWYGANSGGRPRPVAQKLANAWGLFDMHGNVAEWVNDRYDATYYSTGPIVDPTGPASGSFRVMRGGDWFSAAFSARATGRSFSTPSARGDLSGFRLVRTP